MTSKKYYKHIAGLKGISCILIMIGHFLCIYKYAQNFQPSFPPLSTILDSELSFILNEGYWLYLFFVISGYLVAKSKLNTITEFLFRSLNRFFRLAFPIFFSYLIIYLIYISIGFHNIQTLSLFQCDWFQSFYLEQYSITDVLFSPMDVLLLNKCHLNKPYWVLSNMFLASIIIYFLKYCYMHLSKKNETICFSVLIVITYMSAYISPIVMACLIGMMVSVYEDVEGILEKPYFAFWIMVISMALYIFTPTYISNIFFVALIIFIPKVKFMNKIFSSKLFQFLGEISWGIYSFHWPFMCSIGALLMINLQPRMGLFTSYVIACLLVTIVTIVVSIIFRFTLEKFSFFLSSSLDKRLRQFASRISIRTN